MANNKSRASRKNQKNKQNKPLWKKIIKTILLVGLMMGIIGVGVFAYFIISAPKLDVDKLDVAYGSTFYDEDGEAFAERFEENRTKIEYDDIPDVLIDAVVATEDSRFFEHSGIDVRRIGGAIKANITRGFGAEGASTITQQVVENMFLTPEKSIKLKVQEQWLALKLEREFTKEQILEMYLNKIFYGSDAYGVAKASEVYFGKEDLHDLTLLEAAMLAGLPQRPTAYNPFQNPELMEKRVDTVLNLMVRHNKISQKEADEAKEQNVEDVLTDKKPETIPHDAFITQAEKELEEKLTDIDVHTAGLKIYTTLDIDAQEHVEFLMSDSENNPVSYPNDELLAGMSVVDTQTGAIRAIGGSRDQDVAFGSNYAIEANRQAGSTVKPIVAYGPAIEYEKWSTYHQIDDDAPYDIGNASIPNWNRQYQGKMSIRYALEQSLNVPALKTLEEIGTDRAKPFAEGLGLEFDDDELEIQDAIGTANSSASPLQLAGAFSAFGNEGIYTEPYAVTKVEFPDGSVVDLTPESEAVMSDYTAYMVTDMLKGVVERGTGTGANLPDLPLAGKTGSTNPTGKSGVNNSWFAGYTTNYSIAVWSGYKENDRIIESPTVSQDLFSQTMRELSKDKETADFVKPDSVVELEIEKGSDPPVLASPLSSSDNIVKELFVKGTEPDKVSDKHDKLDSVSDLQATFNESDDSIDISWNYDSEIDVTFDVSYKVDDGDYTSLTNTDKTKAEINSVEEGSTYTIKVVAISEEDPELKSDEATTTVETEETDDEEIPKVTGLSAKYNEDNQSIDISWEYDGPDATFEVKINDDTQSVQEKNIEVSGVSPGKTYDITVTPVVDDEKGPSSKTSITIDEEDSEDETEDDNQDESDEEEQEDTDTEDSNDVNEDENNDETNEEGNDDEDKEEDQEEDIQENNENENDE